MHLQRVVRTFPVNLLGELYELKFVVPHNSLTGRFVRTLRPLQEGAPFGLKRRKGIWRRVVGRVTACLKVSRVVG